MLTAIIVLAIFGATVFAWSNVRGAAELATHYGNRACKESGVQWLDHTVMLERMSLRRAPDGWIRVLRRYRFEFSIDGVERQRGHLELLGDSLQWLHMPPPPTPVDVEEPGGQNWQVQIRLPSAPRPPNDGLT